MEVASGVTAAEVDTPTVRPSPTVGSSWTDSLEGTIGVATHHDGMSGTERQDVADDYAQRISESHEEVEVGVAKSFQKLMGTKAEFEHCNCNSEGGSNCLNLTMCATTTGVDEFSMAAWNPLAQETEAHQTVRIPVTGSEWHVVDGTGKEIPSQVQAIDQRTLQLPLLYINHYKVTKEQLPKIIDAYSNKATHVLTFGIGGIPAMGYKVFTAKASSVKNGLRTNVEAKKSYTRRLSATDGPTTVSNGIYELTLDPTTGMTATLKNIKTEISTNLEISWGWYNSSVGGCTPGIEPYAASCDKQASGAYMFRPNTSTVFYPGKTQIPTITIQKGALVTEVYQTFSDWATHVIRLTDGSPYVEVEWTAGPYRRYALAACRQWQ